MHYAIGGSSIESTRRIFQCKKGHQLVAGSPLTVGAYGDPNKGPPVCQICIADWVREQFPMEEMQQVVTVPMVVPMGGATPAAPAPLAMKMCETKGCILGAHPPEQKHIGESRQEF